MNHDNHHESSAHRDDRDPALDDLLGAYATGAVDAGEARRIEAYLDRTPAARAEVDRLTLALDDIVEALTADVVAPPVVWHNIMAAIARGEAEPGDVHASAMAPGWPLATTTRNGRHNPRSPGDQMNQHDQVSRLDPERRRRVSPRTGARARQLLAAAAALAIVAGIAIGARLGATGPSDTASTVAQRATQVAATPGARQAELAGAANLGRIEVVVGADGSAFVVPHDVPAPPAGRQYQLWTIDQGTPVSLAVMGNMPAATHIPTGVTVTQLAVSIEPSGGSAAPTATPVLLGSLA